MPYEDSPGWERQWGRYAWKWDFQLSTTREGHEVVDMTDKENAKHKGAKLTFGEVSDCGVLKMLHNLNAHKKSSFHDLGMGSGKMLIQTYLHYKNLKKCMGVEVAKGRYELAERNIKCLLKYGWRGRKFIGVEFKTGEYFKIVEDVNDKFDNENKWKIGDICIAYCPGLRRNKNEFLNYSGTVLKIIAHSSNWLKNSYEIKYHGINEITRVQHRYLFQVGKQRTLEIWCGSLFDYTYGFNADICVLETDFPSEMQEHLMLCMSTSPIGCTFLTYHDLKQFKCFNWQYLRQIDCNIYDNDRYITSWSQGWRFFLFEHIENYKHSLPYYEYKNKKKNEDANEEYCIPYSLLKNGDAILFRRKYAMEMRNTSNPSPTPSLSSSSNSSSSAIPAVISGTINDYVLHYGEILSTDVNSGEYTFVVQTNQINDRRVNYPHKKLSSINFNFWKSKHRFRIGDKISAYNVNENGNRAQNYKIHTGRVVAVWTNALEYVIKYDEPETTRLRVPENYIFRPPKLHFNIGDKVMACWPKNAQNKNCMHRYKKFPAKIIGINNNGTYKINYDISSFWQSLLRAKQYPEEYYMDKNENDQSFCHCQSCNFNHSNEENANRSSSQQSSTNKCTCFAPSVANQFADNVREMWITKPALFVTHRHSRMIAHASKGNGQHMYLRNNHENVFEWSAVHVVQYLYDIGLAQIADIFKNIGLRKTDAGAEGNVGKIKLTGMKLLSLKTGSIDELLTDISYHMLGYYDLNNSDDRNESSFILAKLKSILSIIDRRNLLCNIRYLKQAFHSLQYYNDHILSSNNNRSAAGKRYLNAMEKDSNHRYRNISEIKSNACVTTDDDLYSE